MEDITCEERVSVIINVCGHNITRCKELLSEHLDKMNLPKDEGWLGLNITVNLTVCDA